MLEEGSIIELSNNKKFIITDNVFYKNDLYYLSLEVDFNTLFPTDNTVIFKSRDNGLIEVNDDSEKDILKEIFINKFINEYSNNN